MFGTTGDSRRLSRPSRSLAQHHQHQQQQQQHGQQQKHMPAPSVYANLHQLQPTIHQPIQPITNLWPTIQSTLSISNTGSICRHLPSLQLQSNGEVTESLFAAGGYRTPAPNPTLLPVTPFELVTKNLHAAAAASAAFNQANSLFLQQSQTDFFGRRTIASNKTETCYGQWQHRTVEPLHIQVPPITTIANLTIKSESSNILTAQPLPSTTTTATATTTTAHYQQHSAKFNGFEQYSASAAAHSIRQTRNESLPTSSSSASSPLSSPSLSFGASTAAPSTPSASIVPSGTRSATSCYSLPDITSGCSRTVPIPWTSSNNIACNTATTSSLIHIKREPCQVSEITTSNHYQRQQQQLPPLQPQQSNQNSCNNNRQQASVPTVLKIETASLKRSIATTNSILAIDPSANGIEMDHHSNTSQSQSNAIPVGIAVARQRLQEHAQQQHHAVKDLNRYGIGISSADLGGASSAFSQNMFFAGTNSTMLPFTSDAAAAMGVSNAVQNAVRNPPTLWQYPTSVPVESMLPMPMPPVGLQLVRDPSSGQLLFLPTATTIEPYQQAVVWPTYTQPHTSLPTAPHLIMPPLTTHQIQPPPLAPLLLGSSDYLTASTTMHQQTQSTRLVALSSDGKRCKGSPTVPMPIQSAPTLIKIEDCSPVPTSGPPSFGDHDPKGIPSTTHSDIGSQLSYYPAHGSLHGSLIQIAPHSTTGSTICPNTSSSTTAPISLCSLDCRSPQSTTQIFSPTTNVVVTSMSCLTPPSEPFSRSDLDSSGVSSLPDVQDATIQTDTPVMSEDDNTNGAEDSAYSSNVIINQHPSLTEELNISVPTSTSHSDQCHITNISDTSTELSSPCNVHDSTSSRLSSRYISSGVVNLSCISTGTSPARKTMSTNYETTVTSTNMLEDERESNCCHSKTSSKASSPLYDPEPTDFSLHNNNNNNNNNRRSQENQEKVPTTSTPDLSGLELLSNSIEAFEKKSFVKQEPREREPSPILHERAIFESQEDDNNSDEECEPCASTSAAAQEEPQPEFVESGQQLGGLNLLCALAEQRFQEEVGGSRSDRKRSSSSDISEPKRKKHKDKHSSKKSKKRDRKEKKRRGSHLPIEGDSRDMVVDEVLEKDLKETYERVKNKYMNCSCRRSDASPDEKCCCHGAPVNWPTVEEVCSAMKSEMRSRLVEITREVQAKKRKLEAMSTKKSRRHRESTPSSSKSSSSSSKISTSVPTLSPSVLSSSSLDCNQNGGNDFGAITKISSDTDSCSSTSSKQKIDTDLVAKKHNSLVGYIFASKKRQNDGNFSTTDEASVNSDISATLKRVAAIKQESFEFEDSSSQPDSVSNIFGGITSIAEDLPSSSLFGTSSLFGVKEPKRKHSSSPKHHKKTKSSKERKHRRKSAEMRERKRLIDERCTLTPSHLDCLGDRSMRVLTEKAGYFYAGSLRAVKAPDIYAVTLDGERRNQPHIWSREEILRDWILEVNPQSASDVPPGTRICAYWSQQQRCLYPGFTVNTGTPERDRNPKFVSVEFDDGDSGHIALDNIRFLVSDCAIFEYDPDPLLSIGKKKQRPILEAPILHSTSEPSTSTNCFAYQPEPKPRTMTHEEKEAHRERRRLKKIRKDKMRQRQLLNADDPNAKRHKHKHKCTDETCKHRKHKKRRKHKKHHRIMEAHVDSPSIPLIKKESNAEEDDPEPIVRLPKHISQHFDERLKTNAVVVLNTNDCKINMERKRPVHVPFIKEEVLTEEEVTSSHTEDSSSSSYNPSGNFPDPQASPESSRIAAFLPARQLWAWSGKGYRRNASKGARNKKLFYKSIQRGKELISVGDSAVFLSTGRPDRPYIGQIESLWETNVNKKVVKVKWYYHPEETDGCPELLYPGALFESPHEDENDVQTISHKCEVLPLEEYTKKHGSDPKKYHSVYDNNDTFYLSGYYDPTTKNLKMENDIPLQ